MAKNNYSKMLKESPIIDMIVNQGGLETRVHLDETNKNMSISTRDVTLNYDRKKFRENPEAYINEQLEAHGNYHQLLREHLSSEYGVLNENIGVRCDAERTFELFPEILLKLGVGLAKTIIAPTCWIRLKTMKSTFKEKIEKYQVGVVGYSLIKSAVVGGNELLKSESANIEISDELKNKVKDCIKLSDELCYLYSRLVDTAEKNVREAEKFYSLFFPNAKLEKNK